MSNRILSISAAAALALTSLSVPAFAGDAGSVYGAKTVGALTLETRGLATDAASVLRQGGFMTAGAVRWTDAPATEASADPVSVYGAGTVGAMIRETAGVATSAAEVARQGGGVTAGAVRWTETPQGS